MLLPNYNIKIKITFGMIVLNGEPFIRYNLRSLYPYAHQIIVVEGACPAAAGVATSDGHSSDSTLATLRQFQLEEDPDSKVIIVTAEDDGHPNGFWEEKGEMSKAYAKRATGKWLWQVDADEFYLPNDIEQIINLIQDQPQITQISFKMKTFSASPYYLVDGFYLRCQMHTIRRLFAWNPTYRYINHRPPTVVNEVGHDMAKLYPISASYLAKKNIFMYHYEQLFPKQVQEKCSYYSCVSWTQELEQANNWASHYYKAIRHPYRVHMVYNYPSWLERYQGSIPPQVLQMIDAIRKGLHPGIELRQTEDIEIILNSITYILGRWFLKVCSYFYCLYISVRRRLGHWLRQLLNRKNK